MRLYYANKRKMQTREEKFKWNHTRVLLHQACIVNTLTVECENNYKTMKCLLHIATNDDETYKRNIVWKELLKNYCKKENQNF